ncbi:MAG: baseplate J/gp47 family protein [Bacillota bacterium]
MGRWPVFFCSLFFFLSSIRPGLAADGPRLVILAVDRLTLQDLLAVKTPHLRRLMDEGAVGLMTTRAIGGLSPEKIYLSIGAGEPQTSLPGFGGLAFDAREPYQGLPAEEAHRLQHGKVPLDAEVFHLGLAGLAAANAQTGLSNRMGRLGEALRKSGLCPAVIGNADVGEKYGREGVLLLMDREGKVALGHVGRDTLRPDPSFPGGRRTDYAVLGRDYDRVAAQADVILVILGDLARLYAESPALTPKMFAFHLSLALNRLDRFLGHLMASSRRPQTILLFAASPPLARLALGERLVPAAIWGKDFPPGLLYSSTTRRTGLLTPYDLTATIAVCCGLNPALLTGGRPLTVVPGSPAAVLPGFYAELVRNFGQREPFFFFYGSLLLVLALAALGPAFFAPHLRPVAESAATFLFGLAVTPVLLLFFALWPLGSLWRTLLTIIPTAFLCGWLLRKIWPSLRKRLAFTGLFVALPVLADVLLGSRLLARSLLGYSPLLGARFYGLGNEYLGVVLGALILAGCALYHPSSLTSKIGVATLFALATPIIALPCYGANIGGGITAVLGLGSTYFLLQGKRFGRREALGLFLGTVVLVALLVLYDLAPGRQETSHLGQLLLRIRVEGPEVLRAIVYSKILVGLRILAYTAWSWVLLALLLLLPLVLAYPPGRLAAHLDREHYLGAAVRGMWVTAFVGLLVNDSGVVVAATVWIYLGLALVHLVLEKCAAAEKGGAGMEVIRVPRFLSFARLLHLLTEEKGPKAILLLPRRARAFRQPLAWELLALYAQKHNLEITVVSSDRELLHQAAAAGFNVSSALPAGREEAAGREEPATRRALPLWALAFAFLLVLLSGLFFFLPRPTVLVIPARRRLNLQATAIVSPAHREAEIPQDRLPGILLHRTGLVVYERTTTGSRLEGATPAQGKVVFVNEDTASITVPAGTIVQSVNGWRFRTQIPVTVPPARHGYLLGIRISTTSGRAETRVVAEKPGSQGNLAPGKVTAIIGPLARRLKVVNIEGFTGGTDRRVPVVAPEDVEMACAEARREMELRAPEEAQALAGPDRILLPNSLAVTPGRATVSPGVGEKGESVRITLPYRVQALSLPRSTLEKFLEEKARREVPAHFAVAEEPFVVEELRDTALAPTAARLEVFAAYTAVGRLERKRLLDALRGKTVAAARTALLGLPEVATVRIDLPPDRRLPRLAWLIRLAYPKVPTL